MAEQPGSTITAALRGGSGDQWSLFVSAVCGRPIALATSNDLYTDGRTVFYDPASSDPDGLALQAALLAIGSFSPTTTAKLITRQSVRRRFLLLESLRATVELADVLPPRTLERIRRSSQHEPPASAEASLALALAARRSNLDAPAWMGTIKPSSLVRAALEESGRRLAEQDKPKGPDDPEDDEDDETAPESKLLKLLQTPAGANPISKYLQKLLGIGRASKRGSASGGDEVPADGHRMAADRSSDPAATTTLAAEFDLVFPPAPTGRLYPEWNFLRAAHRPGWCLVTEFDPETDEERFRATPDLKLRRELARLGTVGERHRRQAEGDTLDLESIIERRVDRHVGQLGDDRIYERRLNTSHDLGVILLLDATGSTGESEDGKRVFDQQRTLVAQLAGEFDALGVRVAAYAFRSYGRQNVQFLRIKRYTERIDGAVERRLGAIEPGGFTRLGAAIRHGAHLARRESGAATDLMVVVGDGLPYDDGYEGRYAHEDTKRALSEAVDAGVAATCLSIGTATDATTLESTWGAVNYAVLDNPEDLAQAAARLFKSSLKTAAASRRRI